MNNTFVPLIKKASKEFFMCKWDGYSSRREFWFVILTMPVLVIPLVVVWIPLAAGIQSVFKFSHTALTNCAAFYFCFFLFPLLNRRIKSAVGKSMYAWLFMAIAVAHDYLVGYPPIATLFGLGQLVIGLGILFGESKYPKIQEEAARLYRVFYIDNLGQEKSVKVLGKDETWITRKIMKKYPNQKIVKIQQLAAEQRPKA